MSTRNKKTEYEEQREIWYKKLKDEGFQDVEQDEYNLKVWSTAFTRKSFLKSWREKESYYYMATSFLNDYKFETELDKVIWEYHVNALSVRDIADTLRRAGVRSTGRGTVNGIIRRLAAAMRKFYFQSEHA